MKYKKSIYLFLILSLIINFTACSKDRPVLKKKLSECNARDVLEYGRALFNAEYYDEAIEEYKKVIAYFPDNKKECAWAQYELAYSYYYMEEYEPALKEFKKINMLYPEERGPVILARKMITRISVLIY